MLVKIFLVSTIIITILIILYELNETTKTSKSQSEEEISEPIQKPLIKKNNSKICKKVSFDLDKNMIKLISPNHKKNLEVKYNEYKSSNNNSIVKDKVEFNNDIIGTQILDNSNFLNQKII